MKTMFLVWEDLEGSAGVTDEHTSANIVTDISSLQSLVNTSICDPFRFVVGRLNGTSQPLGIQHF